MALHRVNKLVFFLRCNQLFTSKINFQQSSIRNAWQYCRRHISAKSGISWVIPAASILRTISFFSANKSSKEPIEPEASNSASNIQIVIKNADDLYKTHKFEELYSYMQQFIDFENDEILWRLARATMEKSKLTEDKTLRKQLVYNAFDIIRRALTLNENNFACHKWFAILLDGTAEYEGIKARISRAYVVKEHFMRAIELNPKDATTLYTLGLWCFIFADMPWYQRKIAGALFAKPPVSTYEEALQYFERAEEMDPNFYSKNLLMLGKTYLRLGNSNLAVLYLSQAREFPLNTADDKDAYREAGELLKSLGIKLEEERVM